MSFSNIKRNNNDLALLTKSLEKMSAKSTGGDNGSQDNYWKPDVDKSGNGMATFRFLPIIDADGADGLIDPWVKIYSHGFQGPGGWLIDNCLTTKGLQCPVCESNSVLWKSEIPDNRKVASSRKRRLSFVSNIYMIDDPKHPENNGKVFLFRYGTKIFNKIELAIAPEFPDEVAFSPFNLDTGANFKLKIRKVEGYQNYDRSEFESQSPIFDDMDKLTGLVGHSIAALIDDKEFKTFEEIQARLDKVLGIGGTVRTTMEQSRMAPKPKVVDESHEEESDFDMSYFESLVDAD